MADVAASFRESSGAGQTAAREKGMPKIVLFFLLSLLVPLLIDIGIFQLIPYRAVLLISFGPSLYYWVKGRAGRHRVADYVVLALAFWVAIAFVAMHGIGIWQTIGFHTLELVGAYMLGRTYIRSPESFVGVARFFLLIAILVMPFVLYEAIVGDNLYVELWGYIGDAYRDVDHEVRLGLDRVQGPFQHPIHFGVFFGGMLGMTYYVAGQAWSPAKRSFATFYMAFTAFFALSSGPMAAMVAQIGMIAWDRALVRYPWRWRFLALLFVLVYVALDLLSNRSPIEVMIGYFALNAQTAYGRILIFEYGWLNVVNNPLFGTGLHGWVRPAWMTESIDMFWMFYPVAHGAPAGILNLGAFFAMVVAVIRAPIDDPVLKFYRMGWFITMFGIFMAGWMVHMWRTPFVLYCFLLGAGSWLLEYRPRETEGSTPDAQPGQRMSRYTRFATRGPEATLSRPPAPAAEAKDRR